MDDKVKGIISYVFGWLGGLIILLAFKNNNKKTTIHACQAIVASVGVTIIRIAYNILPIYIPFFDTVIWALQIIVLVLGITKVVNNDNPEIPVIGDLAKSIFSKAINEAPDVVNNDTNQNTTENVSSKSQNETAQTNQINNQVTTQNSNIDNLYNKSNEIK